MLFLLSSTTSCLYTDGDSDWRVEEAFTLGERLGAGMSPETREEALLSHCSSSKDKGNSLQRYIVSKAGNWVGDFRQV